jgi:hypothetical protein
LESLWNVLVILFILYMVLGRRRGTKSDRESEWPEVFTGGFAPLEPDKWFDTSWESEEAPREEPEVKVSRPERVEVEDAPPEVRPEPSKPEPVLETPTTRKTGGLPGLGSRDILQGMVWAQILGPPRCKRISHR